MFNLIILFKVGFYDIMFLFGVAAFSLFLFLAIHFYYSRKKKRNLEKMNEVREGTLELIDQTKSLIGGRNTHMENTKSLEDLLETTATEEDYKEYVQGVIDWATKLYDNYQFQLLKPVEDDFQSGYAITFELSPVEDEDRFFELFKLAMSTGLEDNKISKTFSDEVVNGNFVNLGSVIIDKGSTGISSILQGDNLKVIVSFFTPEYEKKRLEVAKEQEKFLKEEAEKKEAEKNAYVDLMKASKVLKGMTESIVEEHPEFKEKIDEVEKLYYGG